MTYPMILAVYCTDRGQHPRTLLGDLVLDGDDLRANNGPIFHFPIGHRRKGRSVSIDDHGRVRFRCPRCGRDVPLTGARARQVVTALWDHNHDGGAASLDISMLP